MPLGLERRLLMRFSPFVVKFVCLLELFIHLYINLNEIYLCNFTVLQIEERLQSETLEKIYMYTVTSKIYRVSC